MSNEYTDDMTTTINEPDGSVTTITDDIAVTIKDGTRYPGGVGGKYHGTSVESTIGTADQFIKLTAHLALGTDVAYEDMANPYREGQITEIKITPWAVEYLVQWAEGDNLWSTMNGTGWRVLNGGGIAAAS